MCFKMYYFLIALILKNIHGAHVPRTAEPQSGPNWPTEYYLRGDIIDVFNADSQTFEIWYNEKLNRSRVDLFDGQVKKYYWADREKMFTIHPKTMDLKTIITKCDEEIREEKPYNVLPADEENWTLTGNGTFNGAETDIWEVKTDEYHIKATTKNEGGIDIPLSLEKITYKAATEMTDGHINIVFYDYNSTAEKEIFDIEKEELEDCGSPYYGTMEEKLKYLRHFIPHDVQAGFNRYKTHHKKSYTGNEHQMRREIFKNKWRHITIQNSKNLGYKLDLNRFADWTDDELVSLRGALPSNGVDPGSHRFPHTLEAIGKLVDELPEEYDLRVEGDLPPVKYQQECGSCWAFATTATVEAAIIKKLGGVQLDLSEQSLIDCSWSYGLYGCNGGFLNEVFKYVRENGIPTEAEYGGYLHEDGVCHLKNMSKTHSIKGYTQVTPHSVNALKYAVYTYGPVEVTIHASDDMLLYSSGVFYDMTCKGQNMNHAVVVVGYGTLNGEPYWIVRNSWGETWGLDGYIMMSAKDNICLILDSPYYPVV